MQKQKYFIYFLTMIVGLFVLFLNNAGILTAATITSNNIVVLNGTAYWGYIQVGTYCGCESGALNTALSSGYSIPVPYSYMQNLLTNNDPNGQALKSYYYGQLDAYSSSLGSQVYFGTDPEHGTLYMYSDHGVWKVQCLGSGAQNGNGGTYDDGNACFWGDVWFSKGATYPAALNIATPTAASSSIVLGQSVQLTDSGASGGTGGYTYRWIYKSPGSSNFVGTSAYGTSWDAPPSSLGTYYFEIVVTDSNGDTATSAPISVQVTSSTVPLNPTISPLNPTITKGQSVAFSTTWSGSNFPYALGLYSSSSSTCTPSTATELISATVNVKDSAGGFTFPDVTPTSNTYYCIVISSEGSGTYSTSPTSLVTISTPSPLTIPTPTFQTTNPMNLGQTAQLVDSGASGGSGGYTYQLFEEAPGSSAYTPIAGQKGTSPDYGIAIDANPGVYNFEIQVTDSNGDTAMSGAASLDVIQPTTSPTTVTTTTTTTTTTTSPTTSPTTTPTTTVIYGYGGGGGPTHAAPVFTQTSGNTTCFTVNNLTESGSESFQINKTNFTVMDKYIFSNFSDVIINNSYYSFNKYEQYTLSNNSGNGFYIKMTNISKITPPNFTSPISTISFNICSYKAVTTPPVLKKPTTPVSLNLSIINYTITAISTQSNDTVVLILNNKQVSQGTGIAFYDASWLPAGKYLVRGKDTDSGTFVNQTIIKPYFKPTLKFTKICENNTNYNYSCTTSAQILSHNNILSGKLYVNGVFIGSTNTTINYTTYLSGSYNFTFNTTGNSYYSQNSISYTYQNGSRTNILPILAVIVALCALIILYRKRRVSSVKNEINNMQ